MVEQDAPQAQPALDITLGDITVKLRPRDAIDLEYFQRAYKVLKEQWEGLPEEKKTTNASAALLQLTVRVYMVYLKMQDENTNMRQLFVSKIEELEKNLAQLDQM
jgi:hypothetical protein